MNNKEEKLLKQNRSLLIVIIILIIILIGIIIYFSTIKKEDTEKKTDEKKTVEPVKEVEKEKKINTKEKEETKSEEPTKVEEKKEVEQKMPTKDELIEYTKKKFKEKNLIEEDNIDTWTFDKIQLEGYFEKEPSKKYYAIIGKFKCIEGDSCVYQDQLDDPDKDGFYKWSIAIPVIFNNNNYTFDNPTTTFIIGDNNNRFIELWEDIE